MARLDAVLKLVREPGLEPAPVPLEPASARREAA
jgi:hypothetical protein